MVKYPGEDRKIKTVKTVFRLIHATTGCALMETENLLPKWCVVKCLFVITFHGIHPACIYLIKVNNGNTRIMCGICSKSTIKTLARLQTLIWCLCC